MNAVESRVADAKTGVFFRREDYAGFWLRILVDVIDIAVAVLVLAAVFSVAFFASRDDRVVARISVVGGVGVWLSYFVFLKYFGSRTVGYRLCRVRLVNLQGLPPSLWAVFTRGLFAAIGPMNVVVDLIWLSSDPHRQALRDKVAHTYVVRRLAQPCGAGVISYSRYTILGSNFVFPEVRVPHESTAR